MTYCHMQMEYCFSDMSPQVLVDLLLHTVNEMILIGTEETERQSETG